MTPRTRRSRIVRCDVCGKPAPLGSVCDNCVMTDNQNELTYLAALAKDDTAKQSLKLMSPTERKRIAPTFLSPDALKSFIKSGIITSQHITDLYPLRRKDRTVTTSTATKPAPRTRKARAIDQDQIDAAKVDATPKPKTPRASTKESVRARGATGVLTAAEIARDHNLDARKFRAFLRARGIDRTFPNKSAANKAVRDFSK